MFILFVSGLSALGFALHATLVARNREASGYGLIVLDSLLPPLISLGATASAALCDRSGFWAHGLGAADAARRFGGGWVVGFGFLCLLLALIVLGGGAAVSPPDGSPAAMGAAGLVWLASFFLVALFEETAFRGYLLHTLWRGWGFPAASVISSLLFGAVHLHNGGESVFGALSACLIGYVLCLSVRRTGSLWWAIGFHTGWDWAESYLWGAPDSGLRVDGHLFAVDPTPGSILGGGSVGPEGSPLALVIILILLVLVMRVVPGRRDMRTQ